MEKIIFLDEFQSWAFSITLGMIEVILIVLILLSIENTPMILNARLPIFSVNLFIKLSSIAEYGTRQWVHNQEIKNKDNEPLVLNKFCSFTR